MADDSDDSDENGLPEEDEDPVEDEEGDSGRVTSQELRRLRLRS